MALTDKLSAIADAIRGKTGKTESLTLDQMAEEIAAMEAGGGGGIGAVKFVDVDITVEASTSTAVTYTVDGLEFLSSVENPTKWNSFSSDDAYIAFITPKELTGASSGTTAFNSSICVMTGNTNYTKANTIISYGTSTGVVVQSFGIYGATLNCSDVTDGKIMGNLTVQVQHQSTNTYEVIAGTYNVQVYHLTAFDWGHTS